MQKKMPKGGYLRGINLNEWDDLKSAGLVRVSYWGRIRVETYTPLSADFTIIRHVLIGQKYSGPLGGRWFVHDGIIPRRN